MKVVYQFCYAINFQINTFNEFYANIMCWVTNIMMEQDLSNRSRLELLPVSAIYLPILLSTFIFHFDN